MLFHALFQSGCTIIAHFFGELCCSNLLSRIFSGKSSSVCLTIAIWAYVPETIHTVCQYYVCVQVCALHDFNILK